MCSPRASTKVDLPTSGGLHVGVMGNQSDQKYDFGLSDTIPTRNG